MLVELLQRLDQSSYKPATFFCVPKRVEARYGRVGNQKVCIGGNLEKAGRIVCVGLYNHSWVQPISLTCLDEKHLRLSNECWTNVAKKVFEQVVDWIAIV